MICIKGGLKGSGYIGDIRIKVMWPLEWPSLEAQDGITTVSWPILKTYTFLNNPFLPSAAPSTSNGITPMPLRPS